MLLFEDGMEIPPIIIDVSLSLAYYLAIEDKPDDLPWYYDIKRFLQNQEYPAGSTQTDKRTLRRLALQFFLNGEVLYKKTPYCLLRCLNAQEAKLAMEEVHEGVCGSHMNGHMLARKILHTGYYWLTMEADCTQHVRRCHQCQIYSNRINAPPNELHSMTSP